jgi:hypothetical protein
MAIARFTAFSSALILASAIGVLPIHDDAGALPPTTTVTIPTTNYPVSGTSQLLDAGASPSASQVHYEVTGGTLTNQIVATGTATYYGWLAQWNTTTVPNGTYSLQSVALFSSGGSVTSAPVIIIVNNPAPSISVTIPTSGATEQTTNNILFDAAASPGVANVVFNGTGEGPPFSVTATPTIYGWIGVIPAEPGGGGCDYPLPYSVEAVATYSGGVSGTSAPVSFILDVVLPPGGCVFF